MSKGHEKMREATKKILRESIQDSKQPGHNLAYSRAILDLLDRGEFVTDSQILIAINNAEKE